MLQEMPPLQLPNLTIVIGDQTFSALQRACTARESTCFSIEDPFSKKTRAAVFQLILKSFPMEKMLAYKEFNVFVKAAPWGESGNFSKFMTINSMCLLVAILISIFTYISLVLSNARSDEAKLKFWYPLGMAMLFVGYLFCVLGLVLTQVLLAWVVHIRLPHYSMSNRIDSTVNYPAFIPLAVLAMTMPLVLTFVTHFRFRNVLRVPE